MSVYLLPCLILLLLLYGAYKKVNVYDAFVRGAKQSVSTAVGIFPCLVAVFLLLQLFRLSGLEKFLSQAAAPLFSLFGIPTELTSFLLIRPLSGSGSLAMLTEIFREYGPDSYIGKCAGLIMGSSETVFYLASVYFADTKVKNLGYAIPISLVCSLFGAVVSCLICRFF